jgi:solute:Na+ symporter, SSS family
MKFGHSGIGIVILPLFLTVTLILGWLSRRKASSSNDFLNASRSLPLGIVTLAFIAANCGALEIIGLSAVAGQYGVQAFQFYWIGAIPAMLFLGLVMLPVYINSGIRSVPEYLEKRYDARVRFVNAVLILTMDTALAGIGLYAMSQVLHVLFGWNFLWGTLLAAGIVLTYVVLGGVRATMYNEVFQLIIIVAGLLPLLWRVHHLLPTLKQTALQQPHLWIGLPFHARGAMLDQVGVIFGLGFVLSFSYWCTDFVLMQRALAARTLESARMVPVLAGFGKLGFSLLIVIPALAAAAILGRSMPAAFDQTLPALMIHLYGPTTLALGITALLASLLCGLAGHVSACSAVWTQEIYRTNLRPGEQEQHYLKVGRISILIAILLSIFTSYLAFYFNNLMEYIQLIFSFFNAPFFAIFLLGITTRRATANGALRGLLSGVSVACLHHLLVAGGLLHYGSLMNANFRVAIYAFVTTMIVTLLGSNPGELKSNFEQDGLIYHKGASTITSPTVLWWALSGILLSACLMLNYLWR